MIARQPRPCGCTDGGCFCSCPSCLPAFEPKALWRPARVRTGLRLEYLTIGWNVVEGFVAVAAALAAGSVALLAFGVDSFVEAASAGVLTWRLLAERAKKSGDVEVIERRAQRLVAASLVGLAGYVAIDACLTLLNGDRPQASSVGIALTCVSLLVMRWLAARKSRLAVELESRAMQADAFQTTACFWLSVSALVGIGFNGLFGWWWADPVAALVMCVFIVREAKGAWRGEDCAC